MNIKITPGKTAYLPPTNPGFTVPNKIKDEIKVKETISKYDRLSFFFRTLPNKYKIKIIKKK